MRSIAARITNCMYKQGYPQKLISDNLEPRTSESPGSSCFLFCIVPYIVTHCTFSTIKVMSQDLHSTNSGPNPHTLPPINTLPFPIKCSCYCADAHYYQQEAAFWKMRYQLVDSELESLLEKLYRTREVATSMVGRQLASCAAFT